MRMGASRSPTHLIFSTRPRRSVHRGEHRALEALHGQPQLNAIGTDGFGNVATDSHHAGGPGDRDIFHSWQTRSLLRISFRIAVRVPSRGTRGAAGRRGSPQQVRLIGGDSSPALFACKPGNADGWHDTAGSRGRRGPSSHTQAAFRSALPALAPWECGARAYHLVI